MRRFARLSTIVVFFSSNFGRLVRIGVLLLTGNILGEKKAECIDMLATLQFQCLLLFISSMERLSGLYFSTLLLRTAHLISFSCSSLYLHKSTVYYLIIDNSLFAIIGLIVIILFLLLRFPLQIDLTFCVCNLENVFFLLYTPAVLFAIQMDIPSTSNFCK